MFKKLLLISIGLLSVAYAYCQDIIIKKNGDEIKTRVEEISTNEIKYKKFDNLDGPSYSIAKSEVFIIKYSNGTKEVISNNNSTPVQPTTPANNYYSAPATPSEPVKARIEGEGWSYYQEGRRLSEASLMRVLKEAKNEDAVKTLQSGRTLKTAGKVLFGVGLPLLIAGPIVGAIGAAVISIYNSSVDSYNNGGYTYPSESLYSTGSTMMGVGYTLFGTGLASVVTSGILKGASKKKYLQSTEMYNAKL
ncbi:MAG: hypothetical protein K2Q22_17630 [Cytophagales bacterium]|nr:hypothetical protein [Cytophagales bacterium]